MLAIEVAEYLASLGLVNFDPSGITGDCYIDVVPTTPDNVIVISGYSGPPPDPKLGYDTPNIQVRARAGRDPRDARGRMEDIFAALHNLHHVTLPGGTYAVYCFALQSDPAPLGPDANGRLEYSQNYQWHVRNLTAHRE